MNATTDREPSSEPPRVGHRGDALDALRRLFETEPDPERRAALEALLDALDRGIV